MAKANQGLKGEDSHVLDKSSVVPCFLLGGDGRDSMGANTHMAPLHRQGDGGLSRERQSSSSLSHHSASNHHFSAVWHLAFHSDARSRHYSQPCQIGKTPRVELRGAFFMPCIFSNTGFLLLAAQGGFLLLFELGFGIRN